MAFPITTQMVLEVTVVGSAQGQVVVNRFDYLTGSIPVGSSVTSAQFLTAFRFNWRSFALSFLHTDYVVTRYEARQILSGAIITGTSPAQYKRVYSPLYDELIGIPADDDGTSVGDALPTMVSVSAQKRTGFRGRTRRGATHFSPIVETDTLAGGNTLTPGRLTTINTALVGLAANVLAGLPAFTTFTFSLFSPKEYATAVPPITAPYPVTFQILSYVAKANVGSQVSRKAS